MPSREHYPVIEHGRKHTRTSSIMGRRLMDFGVELIPAARYVFTEATRLQVLRGTHVRYNSLHPLMLPLKGQNFTRRYLQLLDRNYYYVDHSFSGQEHLSGDTTVEDGVVGMRNEGDMGRAELKIAKEGSKRQFTLKQADSRTEFQTASALPLPEADAAAIIRAVLIQQGDISGNDAREIHSVDSLLKMLSSKTPDAQITREQTFNTSEASGFNYSTLRVAEEVLRTSKRRPVVNSQEVTAKGLRVYEDHPGVVGIVGLSLAAGPGQPESQAALQAWIEIPGDVQLSIPERNHMLNDTVRDFQTIDGFVGAFNRQLEVI